MSNAFIALSLVKGLLHYHEQNEVVEGLISGCDSTV